MQNNLQDVAQNLSNLSPSFRSHRSRKRLGRGPGSGTGKTAGKGHKGQRARKSGGVRPGFEGGQTPLYRRVPKRGFTAPSKDPQVTLQLRVLKSFEAGSVVTPQSLRQAGHWRGSSRSRIKILGGDTLDRSLTVAVHGLTASAKAAIEAAGGQVTSLKELSWEAACSASVPASPPASPPSGGLGSPLPDRGSHDEVGAGDSDESEVESHPDPSTTSAQADGASSHEDSTTVGE